MHGEWNKTNAPPYPLVSATNDGLMITVHPYLVSRSELKELLTHKASAHRIAAGEVFDHRLREPSSILNLCCNHKPGTGQPCYIVRNTSGRLADHQHFGRCFLCIVAE